MNNKFKQFIHDAKHVKLHDRDRAAMRAHFAELVGVSSTKTKTPWFTFFALHRSLTTSLSLAIVVVLVTSGVAAAAEGTIPGDVLYPVKVHVTEEVRSAIARTPAARAAWETRRLERRLNEAEKIVQKKSDPQALSSLGIDINAHTERIQKSIDEMERSGNIQAAAEASSNIEAPLNAHKKILREMKKPPEETAGIMETIETSERSMHARRKNLEERVDKRDAEESVIDTKKEPVSEDPITIQSPEESSFSSKQRTRRENRKNEVIHTAEKEFNVSVPRDDEEKLDTRREQPNEKSQRRNRPE